MQQERGMLSKKQIVISRVLDEMRQVFVHFPSKSVLGKEKSVEERVILFQVGVIGRYTGLPIWLG